MCHRLRVITAMTDTMDNSIAANAQNIHVKIALTHDDLTSLLWVSLNKV